MSTPGIRRGAQVAIALATLALSGCSVDPFPPDTLPTIQSMGVRITDGIGTSASYSDVVEATPPNQVQVETVISDGKSVSFTLPREPSPELEITVSDGQAPPRSVRIVSADGEPLSMSRAFEFDPGYVGVEHTGDEESIRMRVSTSRLTGAGQGEVPFTFKSRVR
jgi:hypothetical protein